MPLKWKKSKRIFVNSMSDLFHKDVPEDYILQVFEVMAKADWHIFQILTKRPSRLVNLSPKITQHLKLRSNTGDIWPAHIWLGVSVETIQYEWRVEKLRQVPSAIRFVSAEPLLGSLGALNLRDIDWLIAGGESGPKYRPCNPEWVRELRDNCQKNNVSVTL